MTDIKDQIDHYESIILQAQEELRNLKSLCSHKTYFIGWWSERVGRQDPARICQTCHSNAGQPSQKEINEFMAHEKDNQLKFLIETYGQDTGQTIFDSLPDSDHWSKPLENENEP